MLDSALEHRYAENILEYERDGFTIFRNVIDHDLIAEARDHVVWLTQRFPQFRPEHLHHPLMRDDAFWVRLISDARLLDIAELFLGPNIACFTSHYICKPPLDGQAVLWHQDGAYWKLAPMAATTLWLAVDRSITENGCLWVVPGTHRLLLQKIVLRADVPNMLMSSIGEEHVDVARAVPIELEPGDVSVHHPNIVHGSDANRSNERRCGLDLGYMPTSTSISNDGLYLNPILVRGDAVPGVNRYRARPAYTPKASMAFHGSDDWNATCAQFNSRHPEFVPTRETDEPVEYIVHRMMGRLKAGTTKQ